MNHVLEIVWVFTEAYYHGVYSRSEEYTVFEIYDTDPYLAACYVKYQVVYNSPSNTRVSYSPAYTLKEQAPTRVLRICWCIRAMGRISYPVNGITSRKYKKCIPISFKPLQSTATADAMPRSASSRRLDARKTEIIIWYVRWFPSKAVSHPTYTDLCLKLLDSSMDNMMFSSSTTSFFLRSIVKTIYG